MPEDRSKKALAVSVLAFLFIGGGVSLFFINQSVGDLTGSNQTGFSYGNAVRNAVMPVFSYLGIAEPEPSLAAKASPAGRAKPDPMLNDLSIPADQYDGAPSASAYSGGSGGRGGYSGPPTSIPRMGGGTSGLGSIGGGGGSRSSAQFSDASPSGANRNLKVSGVAGSGGKAEPGKGTLSALKNASAGLTEALRGSSALGAKSKWDQSFGGSSGGPGAGGGGAIGGLGGKTSSYGGSLAKLDNIRSGEISDLKSMSARGGGIPTPNSSSRDTAAEREIAAAGGKGKEDLGNAAAQQVAQAMGGGASGQGQQNSGGRPAAPSAPATQGAVAPEHEDKDSHEATHADALDPEIEARARELEQSLNSFIESYGEVQETQIVEGPNPMCEEFAIADCVPRIKKVEYEDGSRGEFGITLDGMILIGEDTCLAECGCSSKQPPCGPPQPCNPPSCV